MIQCILCEDWFHSRVSIQDFFLSHIWSFVFHMRMIPFPINILVCSQRIWNACTRMEESVESPKPASFHWETSESRHGFGFSTLWAWDIQRKTTLTWFLMLELPNMVDGCVLFEYAFQTEGNSTAWKCLCLARFPWPDIMRRVALLVSPEATQFALML